jgi:MFS family permease
VLNATSAIAMMVFQPIWGNLGDRYGRRPMVIRSMVGGFICVFVMALAQTPDQLLIGRFLQGALTGVLAAANALVSTATPKEKVAFSLGFLQMGVFLGNAVGPLIGGMIADNYDYHAAFYVAAGLMALGAVVVIWLVSENFQRPPKDAPRASVWADGKQLMAMGAFPILLGVMMMVQFGTIIVNPVLTLYVEELHGMAQAATMAGITLAATGVASAITALLLGRISDRIGHVKILAVCLIGSAVTYIPQAYVQDMGQLMTLRILLGFFLGGLLPSTSALIAVVVPLQKRSAAFGLGSSASAAANFVAPLAAGAIVAVWDIRSVFSVTAGLYVVFFAWVFFGFRRHPVGEIVNE